MKLLAIAVLWSVLVFSSPASAGVEAEAEAGIAFVSRNDTRIPGNQGTTLSLVDDLHTPATPVFRLRLGYRFGQRHLVTALYAPLQLNATGTLDKDIVFMGATYSAGSDVLAVYRFNSYRITYRYSFVWRDNLDVAAGFTGKVRDAETSLYGAQVRKKTNVGFVPLLNVHVAWRPRGGAFGVLFDADALAAPQGRAEDVLVALTWRPREDAELRLGYRMLEGGADNAEVYSFAWIHYVVANLAVAF